MESPWRPPGFGEGGPALSGSSPSPGLRKPRLVKQRKHGSASRPQPAASGLQGVGLGMRLFPTTTNEEVKVFREGVGEVNSSDGCELRLGRSEFTAAEISGSGFGAGTVSEKTSDPGGSDPTATQTAFVFGASSGRIGVVKDDSSAFDGNSPAFAFGGDGARKISETNYGSSGRFDERMISWLPDEMQRMNIDNARESGYGDSKVAGSQTSTSGTNPFALKSGIDAKLSEEIRKLRVGTSGHRSTEEARTSYEPGINGEKLPVYNDSKISQLQEEMNKLKVDATLHGIQGKQATHGHSQVGKKSSFVFGAGLPDALSKDMKKLNIETSGGNKQTVGGSNDKAEVNKGSFGFHANVPPTDPVEMRKLNSETHVHLHAQGSKVMVPGGFATPVSEKGNGKSDRSSFSNLHNEIRKLNISNTGIGVDRMENTDGNAATTLNSATDRSEPGYSEEMRKSTVDNFKLGFEKGSKVGQPSSQVAGRKTNIFGNNKTTTGTANTGNGFPGRINHFNFVNEPKSQFGKGGGLAPGGETFVFGDSARAQNLSTLNDTSLDTDILTKLPDDLGRLNIRPPEEMGGARENSQCSNSAESSSFVFSSGSSGCPLQRENSAPSFTFQARNHDAGSDAGNMSSSHMPTNSSKGPPHTSSFGLDFSSGNTAFAFMGSGGMANSSTDHHISKDSSWIPHSSSFTGKHPEPSSSKKTGLLKNARPQKRKVKLRKPAARKDNIFLERESNLQDDSEFNSAGSCSPMDFSPYQETVISDSCSREASVSSDGFTPVHTLYSEDAQPQFYDNNVENLVSAAQNMVINEYVMNLEKDAGARDDNIDASFDTFSSFDKEQFQEPFLRSQIHATETVPTVADKKSDLTGNVNVIPKIDTEDIYNQASDEKSRFAFRSNPDDATSSNFTFSASSSSNQGSALPPKRLNRKKNLMKGGPDSISSSLNEKFLSISSPMNFLSVPDDSKQIDLSQKLGSDVGVLSVSKIEEKKPEANKDFSASEATTKSSSESLAALEACEKWRLRGNQAYADGHLSKAEEYYTRGVDCAISQSDKCKNCMQALKLCYSNRAAARMSLGRIREALSDCKKAITIDQTFGKALLRAANCHLALGEAVEAVNYFQKCLKLVNDSNLADKMLDEASHGLQKAQKVLEYVSRYSELIKQSTHDALTDMLQIVSEALAISPYSENLIEMKANALLMLRQYDEVIKLCEKTKDISERNSSSISSDDHVNDDAFNCIEHIPEKVWRLYLISKSYFYQGKVEEALQLLWNNGLGGPVTDKCRNELLGSLASFALTLQELLSLKVEGNKAFMAGRHAEAVEYYSKALACSTESRAFSAICFCNRAAAYQALGQITDAIADCSLAIALDANYPKAISRRATLHEMIRDYAQAARDLSKLISLLEVQSNEKASYAELRISARNSDEIKRAHHRLNIVEDEARKGIPLDMYMILGIVSSSSPADIKKAYRKAALKHHPDKACQLLAKGDNNVDTLWKDVASEVHKDADYLFKTIGEAYAVLSDSNKRLQYDAEEERFALRMEYGNTSKAYEDVHNTKFDKSGSKQHSWNNSTSQGSSHKKWPGYSQSNWYFQKGK